MEFLDVFMPTVWFVILALFLLLYVILDGFDLGVGILSLTSPNPSIMSLLPSSGPASNASLVAASAASTMSTSPSSPGTFSREPSMTPLTPADNPRHVLHHAPHGSELGCWDPNWQGLTPTPGP